MMKENNSHIIKKDKFIISYEQLLIYQFHILQFSQVLLYINDENCSILLNFIFYLLYDFYQRNNANLNQTTKLKKNLVLSNSNLYFNKDSDPNGNSCNIDDDNNDTNNNENNSDCNNNSSNHRNNASNNNNDSSNNNNNSTNYNNNNDNNDKNNDRNNSNNEYEKNNKESSKSNYQNTKNRIQAIKNKIKKQNNQSNHEIKNRTNNEFNNNCDKNINIDNMKESKCRKSSIAIFIPSITMTRMSDELNKSSQEKLYSCNYGNTHQSVDVHCNPKDKLSSRITNCIENTNQIEKKQKIKFIRGPSNSKESSILLSESEDEFEKIFRPLEDDHLIELEECHNIDESKLIPTKENYISDASVSINNNNNNKNLLDDQLFINPNNTFVIDEGSFTMDCIKVSETMNDALEKITFRRKEDLETFSMETSDITSIYKEKIESNQKQYTSIFKSKIDSIKNSHKANLKSFKERESIIHYKLTETDSKITNITKKFENIQSLLRKEINRNKVYLEKKISELRESLKYAC